MTAQRSTTSANSTGSIAALAVLLRPRLLVRVALDVLGAALVGTVLVDVADGGAGLGAGVLILVMATVGLVVVNRIKVIASDSLTSCGGLRTCRWSREAIAGFVLTQGPPGTGSVDVVLRDGKTVTLSATKVIGGRKEAQATAESLNAWLHHGGGTVDRMPPSQPPPSEASGQGTLDPRAQRAFVVRIWSKVLAMAAGLGLAAVLYLSGGLVYRLVATLVLLPGAFIGWRELRPLFRHRRGPRPPRSRSGGPRAA